MTIRFDFPDSLARQASAEYWRSVAKPLVKPGGLLMVLACLAVFLWSCTQSSHWLWLLLCGAGPAIWLAALALWLGMAIWAPRAFIAKLSHLPNRSFELTLADDTVTMRSATERLEVVWSELKELLALPSFFVLKLKGGAELPVPRAALGTEAEAWLVTKARLVIDRK